MNATFQIDKVITIIDGVNIPVMRKIGDFSSLLNDYKEISIRGLACNSKINKLVKSLEDAGFCLSETIYKKNMGWRDKNDIIDYYLTFKK